MGKIHIYRQFFGRPLLGTTICGRHVSGGMSVLTLAVVKSILGGYGGLSITHYAFCDTCRRKYWRCMKGREAY